MGINLSNIATGLSKVRSITAELSNLGQEALIEIEKIEVAAYNPYAEDDTAEDIHSLADEIQAVGLINPLGVIDLENDRYQLFSGEKRFSAINMYLHWEKVPCRVFRGISKDKAQLMLHIANHTREYTSAQKLQHYTETNELLKKMKESGEFTGAIQSGIADLLNVSERQVGKYKKIAENLSLEEQHKIFEGQLGIEEAYATSLKRALKKKDPGTVPPPMKEKSEVLPNFELAEPDSTQFQHNQQEPAETIHSATYGIETTVSKFVALKEFMQREGIRYEKL